MSPTNPFAARVCRRHHPLRVLCPRVPHPIRFLLFSSIHCHLLSRQCGPPLTYIKPGCGLLEGQARMAPSFLLFYAYAVPSPDRSLDGQPSDRADNCRLDLATFLRFSFSLPPMPRISQQPGFLLYFSCCLASLIVSQLRCVHVSSDRAHVPQVSLSFLNSLGETHLRLTVVGILKRVRDA
jgi:hypothetical protein